VPAPPLRYSLIQPEVARRQAKLEQGFLAMVAKIDGKAAGLWGQGREQDAVELVTKVRCARVGPALVWRWG
jgi:hypothetical protein